MFKTRQEAILVTFMGNDGLNKNRSGGGCEKCPGSCIYVEGGAAQGIC